MDIRNFFSGAKKETPKKDDKKSTKSEVVFIDPASFFGAAPSHKPKPVDSGEKAKEPKVSPTKVKQQSKVEAEKPRLKSEDKAEPEVDDGPAPNWASLVKLDKKRKANDDEESWNKPNKKPSTNKGMASKGKASKKRPVSEDEEEEDEDDDFEMDELYASGDSEDEGDGDEDKDSTSNGHSKGAKGSSSKKSKQPSSKKAKVETPSKTPPPPAAAAAAKPIQPHTPEPKPEPISEPIIIDSPFTPPKKLKKKSGAMIARPAQPLQTKTETTATVVSKPSQKELDADLAPTPPVKAQAPKKATGSAGKDIRNSSKKTPKTKKQKGTVGTGPLFLEGLTFVITGVLDTMDRPTAEDLIKTYGGKATGGVSGKTDFLVIGSTLEDGRDVTTGRKYMQAKEKDTRIITEEEFLKIIEDGKAQIEPSSVSADDDVVDVTPVNPTATQAHGMTGTPLKPVSTAIPAAVRVDENPFANMRKAAASRAASSSSSSAVTQVPSMDTSSLLWTDKHAPTRLDQLVGNANIVQKLKSWLMDWDKVHIQGIKKDVKFNPNARFSENLNAKAALISGPPGIGKTTTAKLLALQLGFLPIEMNASDQRNKGNVENVLMSLVGNQIISSPSNPNKKQKACLIMDEVDGMSAGDRGGTTALIACIKKSKIPIICICNDRQSTKVRSLANSCLDLKFQKPQKPQIAKRMMEIARSEGLQIEENAMNMVVESVGNDIRQVLNMMQMWRKRSSSMKYSDLKDKMAGVGKDAEVGPFEACTRLLTRDASKKYSIQDRVGFYFVDYDLMPLLIQENYLTALGQNASEDSVERMAKAAESIAEADIYSQLIRRKGEWGLLNEHAFASTIIPAHLCANFLGFPTFPQWLGKNSSASKRNRMLRELHTFAALSISSDRVGVRTDYTPAWYNAMMKPILEKDKEGIPETFAMLDSYGLTYEHLKEYMFELQLIDESHDPFKNISSQTKAALTRESNKDTHHTKVAPVGKVKRKGAAGPSDSLKELVDGEPSSTLGEEEEEEGVKNEAENDAVDKDSLIKMKKPRGAGTGGKKGKAGGSVEDTEGGGASKAKGKGKAKATPSTTGAGRGAKKK